MAGWYGKRGRKAGRKNLRKGKKTAKRNTVSKRIRNYVKKAIHRNLENKERSIYGTNLAVQSCDSTSSTIPLLLQTLNGTTEETRIGNQIKVVKGQIKFAINLLPYNVSLNPNPLPVWVRVMVVRDLITAQQQGTMPATTYNNIFRAGATAFTFGGNPLDMCAQPNKDIVRVLYNKVFKLGTSFTNINVSNIPNYNGSYCDNSPMAKMLTINWGKWCKKQLKYNDGTAYPNNENLYLLIQSVYADGSTTSGNKPIEWHYQSVMQFEDA